MELIERTKNGIKILELTGRFDAFEASKVTQWTEQNISASQSKVILNLKGVHFIDSVGLAVLVKVMKRCREVGGQLYLCELQQAVIIILELTHLDKALTILTTEETALNAFGDQATVAAPTLEIRVQEHQLRIFTLIPNGRLDAFTIPALRDAQNKLLDEGGIHFILDLRQVTFMDSAGMSALVNLLKRARQGGGNVVLVNPEEESTRRILTITKFDQVFTVVTSVEEGYRALL